MNGIYILLGVVLVLMILLPLKGKKTDEKVSKSNLKEYPYKKKYLLTKTEYAFYRILKKKCDEAHLLICPKVRLEDYIQVDAKENIQRYRGYIKSRHVDFLLCDDKLNILGAIELDDKSHNSQKQMENDKFKDKLFEAVKLPLFRVLVAEKDYSEKIQQIIEEIT